MLTFCASLKLNILALQSQHVQHFLDSKIFYLLCTVFPLHSYRFYDNFTFYHNNISNAMIAWHTES